MVIPCIFSKSPQRQFPQWMLQRTLNHLVQLLCQFLWSNWLYWLSSLVVLRKVKLQRIFATKPVRICRLFPHYFSIFITDWDITP